jgi:serine/threonine protein kinase
MEWLPTQRETDLNMRDLGSGEVVFARYELKHVLGQGGMGVVWLARDRELNREVALKFVPEALVYDVEAIADLKRETSRCLELTHPNIVRIYDFANDRRRVAISMEYVDGGSLSAQKSQLPEGCFEVSALEPLLRQFLDGLTYAHEHGRTVHRDLKPANLMVHTTGRLKIADFGIASTVSESASRLSLRPSSGTLPFMSPEQALGGPPCVTDDIYSFGATVYDLLTGKPPFYCGDLIHQLAHTTPPTMSRRRSELGRHGEPIPKHWDELVAACLAKKASERPQSAAEIRSRLEPSGPSFANTAAATVVRPLSLRKSAPAASEARPETPASAATPIPQPAAEPPARRSRGLALVAVALALGGVAAWKLWPGSAVADRPADTGAAQPPSVHPAPARSESTPFEQRPAAVLTGTLTVNSIPAGAQVLVDGRVEGATPMLIRNMRPGSYRVGLSMENREPVDFIATVEAGKNFDTGIIHLARKPLSPPETPMAAAPYAPKVEPPPAIRRPAVDPDAGARAIVIECLRARAGNDDAAELACYSSPVDYYDEGQLTRAVLKQHIQTYRKQWPQYAIGSMSDVGLTDTGDPAVKKANVSFSFQASNPANGKLSRGTAHLELWLRREGYRYVITKVRESVTDRQKNFR